MELLVALMAMSPGANMSDCCRMLLKLQAKSSGRVRESTEKESPSRASRRLDVDRSRSQVCDRLSLCMAYLSHASPRKAADILRDGNSADLKLFAERRCFSSPATHQIFIMFSRLMRPESALRAASAIPKVRSGQWRCSSESEELTVPPITRNPSRHEDCMLFRS